MFIRGHMAGAMWFKDGAFLTSSVPQSTSARYPIEFQMYNMCVCMYNFMSLLACYRYMVALFRCMTDPSAPMFTGFVLHQF